MFQLHQVTQTEKNLLNSCNVSRLMAALQDKTLPDDSLSLSFQKSTILGPALIDGLLWMIVKSAHSSLWSSKVDAENLGFIYI